MPAITAGFPGRRLPGADQIEISRREVAAHDVQNARMRRNPVHHPRPVQQIGAEVGGAPVDRNQAPTLTTPSTRKRRRARPDGRPAGRVAPSGAGAVIGAARLKANTRPPWRRNRKALGRRTVRDAARRQQRRSSRSGTARRARTTGSGRCPDFGMRRPSRWTGARPVRPALAHVPAITKPDRPGPARSGVRPSPGRGFPPG